MSAMTHEELLELQDKMNKEFEAERGPVCAAHWDYRAQLAKQLQPERDKQAANILRARKRLWSKRNQLSMDDFLKQARELDWRDRREQEQLDNKLEEQSMPSYQRMREDLDKLEQEHDQAHGALLRRFYNS